MKVNHTQNQSLLRLILSCLVILLLIVSLSVESAYARQAPDTVAGIPVNYDESLVGTYQLPDPFILSNGERVSDPESWYEKRHPNDWGAISAWAWGLSRAMDYFEQDEDIDEERIALMGVSRLGKTVLWTAARDSRFGAVIASCSGEGGAALSRRNFGETVAHLTAPSRYPYQFSESYGLFGSHIHHLPVDANLLLSLIAPRPVLLQTRTEDLWSDPKGEFLAAVDAGRVYDFLGAEGLQSSRWPDAGEPVWGTLSYYMHEGGHGTLPSDWEIFMEFLKTHLMDND